MLNASSVRLVWVTRPEEDADALAFALRAIGIESLIAPLLSVDFHNGPPLELAGVQAILATSANGVRALARRSGERHLPLLAVGDATASAARALGFNKVESAAGDVVALADLACRRLRAEDGELLHATASDRAGDLAGRLAAAGFRCRREVLYSARPADFFAPAVERALVERRLDGLLLYSPRTAATLVRLLAASPLTDRAVELDCFCLSHSVADVAAALPWRSRLVAARPNQEALLTAVRQRYDAEEPHSAVDSAPATGYLSATLAKPERSFDQWHDGEGDGGMQHDHDKQSAAGGPHQEVPEAPDRPSSEPPSAPLIEPGLTGAGPVPPPDESIASQPAGGAGSLGGDTPRLDPWGSAPPSAASDDTVAAPTASAKGDGRPSAAPMRTKPAPMPAKSASAGRSFAIAAVVLLLLAGAGGAVWYTHFYAPPQPPASEQVAGPQSAELVASLDALEARQARIRQQLDAMAPRLDAVERALLQLRQTVEQQSGGPAGVPQELVDRIARLESQAATATSLAQHVRSLEGTVEAARDTAGKLASTVLAVGQLTQALTIGGPFVRPLAAVRGLGGSDPDIAQAAVELERWAGQGVPTLADLRARFPEMADAVVRAAPVTAGESWSDKVIDRLASLITIRRTGEGAIGTGGVDGALATAEAALAGGDLQAAVTALRSLPGVALAAAQAWMDAAESRLAAERALAVLQQRAIARLSEARG